MACGCRKKKEATAVIATLPASGKSNEQIVAEVNAVAESFDIGLSQCYLCAKKHIGRARQFFEEYHNGYPDHIKNLVDTLFEAESDIYGAFQLWQSVQDQMDMAAGELLGNNKGGRSLKQDHIDLAVMIRKERLKFDQNPLYVPNFEELKYKIHRLQHTVLKEELETNE